MQQDPGSQYTGLSGWLLQRSHSRLAARFSAVFLTLSDPITASAIFYLYRQATSKVRGRQDKYGARDWFRLKTITFPVFISFVYPLQFPVELGGLGGLAKWVDLKDEAE